MLEFIKRWSIRKNLYILVLYAIFPALLVIVIYGVVDYRRSVSDTSDKALILAKSVAFQQQLLTENTRVFLYTLARLPEVQAADAPAMHKLFKELLNVHPNYTNVFYADMQGTMVSASHELLEPINVFDRKYFQDTILTRRFSAGEYTVGRLIKHPIFHFSTPVFTADGVMKAVLVAAIRLDQYDSFFQGITLPPLTRCILLDHDYVRSYRFPFDENAPLGTFFSPYAVKIINDSNSDDGTYYAPGPGGTDLVLGFVKLRLTPTDNPYIIVISGMPNITMAAMIFHLAPAVLLLIGATILALLTARFLGTTTIGQGLDRLTQATSQLASGNLAARIGDLTGCREIQKLGQAFDQMAETLSKEMTERKRAEDALRESEERHRALFSSVSDPVLVADIDTGILVECNLAAERYFGRTREQLIGMPQRELHPPTVPVTNGMTEDFRRVVTTPGQIEEVSLCAAGGEVRHTSVQTSHFEIGGQKFVLGVFRDVTERRRVEKELQYAKASLQAAMDQSPAGIAIADAPSGMLRYVNDAGLLIRGGDRESVVNGVGIEQYVKSWQILDFDGRPLRPDEVPLARAIMFGETCSRDFIVRRDNSDDRFVSANAAPIRDETGVVVAGIVVFTDITERKRTEVALLESESRLTCVLEGSQLGFWDWNLETGVVVRNERWAEMLGYTLKDVEFTVNQWEDFLHPDDREWAWQSIQAHLQGLTPMHRAEYRMMTKDGHYRWILDQARVVQRDADGRPLRMSGTHTDITERKQIEQELRYQQEMLTRTESIAHVGSWEWDITTDTSKWSGELFRIVNYPAASCGASKTRKQRQLLLM